MDRYQIILIVLVSITLLLSLIHFIMIEFVKRKSHMYKELKMINKKYKLDKPLPKQKEIIEKCKTKREYDSLIMDDYLQKNIESDKAYFDNLVLQNEFAYHNYRSYVKEYTPLLPESPRYEGRFKIKDIRKWVFFFYEKLIYSLYKLKPFRYTKVYMYFSYTSPQGKKAYSKHHIYSYAAVKKHYNYVEKMIEQKTTRQNLIRIERAKVTASLRDSVFKRDNYTCQKCGARRSDGVMLVVDHIVPLSKGGKTELGNLQTLCDRCNLGKGDKDN